MIVVLLLLVSKDPIITAPCGVKVIPGQNVKSVFVVCCRVRLQLFTPDT
jgi:hypothetical protein